MTSAHAEGGTLWVLASRVLQNFNGLLLSLLLVRHFGLGAAGTLVLATTGIVVFGLLGTFGLPYSFARLTMPMAQRNTLGLMAAVASVPLSLPPIAALGLLCGHSRQESVAIMALCLAGPYFAQCNLVNALQILNGRPHQAVLTAAANLLGLAMATLLAHSLTGFALTLAACRSVGVVWAFLLLPCAPIAIRTSLHAVLAAARYLAADLINLGSDQAVVLAVGAILTRADLGLLGLCRQLMTVADTPGWSHMQAVYPAAVAAPASIVAGLRRSMVRLGSLCGAIGAILVVPLAEIAYRTPRLAVLGPLLLCATPLRYLLSVQDLRLRAIGQTQRATVAAGLRCVLAAALIPGAAWFATRGIMIGNLGGAAGAVCGMIVTTGCSILVTAGISRFRQPHAPERSTTGPARSAVTIAS